MTKPIFRNTWAEIDLNAIRHNVRQMKASLPEETSVMAVVKADGYGHGATGVATAALEAGASALGVALLEEAIHLREDGFTEPILVFGWVDPEDAPTAAAYDITITYFQEEWLKAAMQKKYERPLKLHMKWDTGMGRLGIRTEQELIELLELTKKAEASTPVELTGIFTHFATADGGTLDYFQEQCRRLEELLAVFKDHWQGRVELHIGNSAASIRFPENMHDFVRFGIAMYGLYPSDDVRKENAIDLEPAFSLKCRLTHVKKMRKGESISYGATYTTSDDEWIGTLPIGYADGWIRKLQGKEVLVDGKRVPIVGRICMDQCMIRLDQEYPVGEMVTLIGKDGQDQIEADEVAAYLDTINYEIPTTITDRVPRVLLGE